MPVGISFTELLALVGIYLALFALFSWIERVLDARKQSRRDN